jgi:hypothetical protein
MARYLRSLTFNLALALLIIGCVLAVLHGPVAWVLVHGANVKSSFGSLFGMVTTYANQTHVELGEASRTR